MIKKIALFGILVLVLVSSGGHIVEAKTINSLPYKEWYGQGQIDRSTPIVDEVSQMIGVYPSATTIAYDMQSKEAIGYFSEGYLMPIDEGEPAQLMDVRNVTTVGGNVVPQTMQVVQVEGRTIPKEALLAHRDNTLSIHRDDKNHIIGALTTEEYVRFLAQDLSARGMNGVYVGPFSSDELKRYTGTISLNNGETKVYVYVYRGSILLRVAYLIITNGNGEYGRDFFKTIKKYNLEEDLKRNS